MLSFSNPPLGPADGKKGETADSFMGPSDTEGSSREKSDWKSSLCGAMKRCGMDTTSRPSPNSGLSSASLSPNLWSA